MKRKNIVLCIVSAAMLFTATAAGREFAVSADTGAIENVSVAAKGDKITFHLPSETDGVLVRYHANEYHSSEDFLSLYDGQGDDNQADGYTEDRKYYSTDIGGVIEYELNGETQIHIAR